ncbi:ABC transporter permease family protein [Picrophilus oshimae]|uniref:Peptide/nickel transport system permease protein n=1 Tax=Picrophilus torridus (strain ATCC 700027 / DSM 9790 / JCM 10055 / NBRC 100828 / KAW 2/3) TaxID=1122961 RepID=A0A8G2L6W1_PICTO|nr:hypothetical protein [Picrophilus oshimae]SMD30403.1 peptide/nickel transport system permease protein [Picrophilus oshimae DSM 9789]
MKLSKIALKYIYTFLFTTAVLFIFIRSNSNIYIEKSFSLNYNYSIKSLGLKYPVPIQYFYYLKDIITGNLGYVNNPYYNGSFISAIHVFLPNTLFIIITSFIVSLILGYYIGIKISMSGFKFNISMILMPFFYVLTGLSILLIFGSILGVLPVKGTVSPLAFGPKNHWVIPYNNNIIVTYPTGSIIIDSIIHLSGPVFLSSILYFIMPFVTIVIPTMVYTASYVSMAVYNEIKRDYGMSLIIYSNSYKDMISKLRNNIRSKIISGIKRSFLLVVIGSIISGIIFSYQGMWSLLFYSSRYNYNAFSVSSSVLIFFIIIIIFYFIVDAYGGVYEI